MNTKKDDRPLLIIKTGAAIHQAAADGDFEDWIAAGMGLNGQPVQVCRVDQGEALPAPEDIEGVVITGSPAMVTQRLDWSEATAEWLRRAVPSGLPILGICYGHQLLAHALGGRVAEDPSGREIGTVRVRLENSAAADPLFRDLPPVFDAQATHQESVIELPPGAVELAASPHPANHAFRVGPCAWGVQFHPEFDDDVMRSYLQARAQPLRNEGLDPDSILRGVRPAPVAAGVLGNFSKIVFGRDC
ncbi:MAG: glutamine amidotransferase [Acidobacteria bacterium]|nr:MAG: glutamine amidotransferase [Acidobacteriota bacterium]